MRWLHVCVVIRKRVAIAVECDGYTFAYDHAFFILREHFKVQSLDGFGCGEMQAAIGAAGAILHYLKTQLHRQIGHIARLTCYQNSSFVLLDAATQSNLELITSLGRNGARDTSLLGALDRTVTPMGGRKLRDWILHALREIGPLRQRQELIAELLAEPFLLSKIRELLRAV